MLRQALSRLTHFLKYLFHRRRIEDDLDEELRSSFDMLVDQHVASGMSLTEAYRTVRIEFEGLDQVKERTRDSLMGTGIHTVIQDVRYAWRGLCRLRSFTFVSVLMLALGIGVTTAVFSVFYAVLLHPLPYDKPEQLAVIWASFRAAGTARAPVSGAILSEIQHRNRSFANVAGIWTITRTFIGDNPEQVKAARVTANFFDVLGVRALHGHTFVKEEEGGPAILLTESLFRRRFAADASLISKGLPMQGDENTLIGVLPANFQLHFAPDANVPSDVQVFQTFWSDVYRGREQYFIRIVGRLKSRVSMAEAQQDLDRVAAEIREVYALYAHENLQLTLTGMQADAVRDVKPALAALFAGSAFVLLICCINVTGLLVARASDRRKEMALRLALGASRGRILRQLLVEGSILCAIGGAAGIIIGWAGFRGILAIRPERLAHIDNAGLSWPVLTLAAVSSLTAAMLFGLVPALESFRIDLVATLRASGRSWLRRFHRCSGSVLVIGEVALAFVLVTSAALTSRTLSNIEQVRPGFEPHSLLAFQVAAGEMQFNAVAEWSPNLPPCLASKA